mgnify:CR=1 FL=1
MTTFTAKGVSKLIREGGERFITEPAPHGTGKLALRIRASLAEWCFQYFHHGKRRLIKVGNAGGEGALTLAEARSRAEKHRRLVQEGLDPKVEERRVKIEAEAQAKAEAARGTVSQLFRAYVEDLKARDKPSWTTVEKALLTGRYAAAEALGRETKAAEIGPHHIRPLLREAYERGPSMASHLRGYLSAAFRYGIGAEHDYTRDQQDVAFGLKTNPVAAIPPDRSARKPGERVLTAEEIKSAWFDMPKHGITGQVHRAVKLHLAVGGQRVMEVVEALKEEFDLESRVWTIPTERTKNGREHRVPLTDRALQLVQESIEESGESPYLFPHMRGGEGPMAFTSLRQAVAKMADAQGRPRWSPRDIRRTARTMLAEAGEPDHRLDYHFNHGRSVGVGQKHYDRSVRLSEKTKTMSVWDGLLARVIGEKAGKVLPMTEARSKRKKVN